MLWRKWIGVINTRRSYRAPPSTLQRLRSETLSRRHAASSAMARWLLLLGSATTALSCRGDVAAPVLAGAVVDSTVVRAALHANQTSLGFGRASGQQASSISASTVATSGTDVVCRINSSDTAPMPGCAATTVFLPAGSHCATNCEELNRAVTTETIHVAFATPVYQLSLATSPVVLCSGTLPTATFRDSTGAAVGVIAFALAQPDDCGADDVTGYLTVVTFPGPVSSLEISPPSPWTWNVTGVDGRAYVNYGLTYHSEPPPPPCPPYADTALNDAALRQALANVFATSAAEKRERSGWIYRDQMTGAYRVEDYSAQMNQTTRTSCAVDVYFNAPPIAGYGPIAPWHTHPIDGGATYPSDCTTRPPNTIAGWGPSPDIDVPLAARMATKTLYAIDRVQAARVNPDSSVTSTRRQSPASCVGPNWVRTAPLIPSIGREI